MYILGITGECSEFSSLLETSQTQDIHLLSIPFDLRVQDVFNLDVLLCRKSSITTSLSSIDVYSFKSTFTLFSLTLRMILLAFVKVQKEGNVFPRK